MQGSFAEASYSKQRFKTRSKLYFGIVLLLTLFLWCSYKQIKGFLRQPQAVLVLGGAPEREVFAAKFASQHQDLPIWVSSGSNPEYAEWVFFEQAGIDPKQVHFDRSAIDTVTNFTTLIDELEAAEIRSLYLITSDYHMRRSAMIGQIVLGSRDISFKQVPVPSNWESEPLSTALRDSARSVLWLLTGQTGSEFGQALEQYREIDPKG